MIATGNRAIICGRPELGLDQATNDKTEADGNRGHVENEAQAHMMLLLAA